MKTIRIKTVKDRYKEISLLSIITFLYMCKSSFTNCATAIGVSTTITAGVILISAIGLLLFYTLANLKDIRFDGIFLVLACVAFFANTIEIHPEYIYRYQDIYNEGRFSAAAVFGLGAGIYTYYIFRLYGTDVELIYDTYKPIPYFIFFLNIPTMLKGSYAYAMDFGYQMELAAILFLVQYLHGDKKKGKLILSGFAMFFGVIYGARASILGYLVFIVFYLIWKKKATVERIIFLGVAISGTLIYNSRIIMMGMYNWISSMGIESRTLYLIATGDILASDYARQNKIWPVLTKLINESSLFKVYGAFGDRYYLSPLYPYAHNMVLEILVTFGKFFGGIILILIVYHFIKTCVRNRGTGGILTLAFGCFCICRLMFSSSFWMEPYFWVFLAMMVNCAKLYKLERSIEVR